MKRTHSLEKNITHSIFFAGPKNGFKYSSRRYFVFAPILIKEYICIISSPAGGNIFSSRPNKDLATTVLSYTTELLHSSCLLAFSDSDPQSHQSNVSRSLTAQTPSLREQHIACPVIWHSWPFWLCCSRCWINNGDNWTLRDLIRVVRGQFE